MAARLREQVTLPWGYVALVILPIAAFFASEALLAWLGQVPEQASALPCPDTVVAAESAAGHWREAAARWPEAAARMQLLAMLSLYSLFGLVVFSKFGWDLFRLFHDSSRLKLLVAYALCVFAGALVIWLAHQWGGFRRATDLLGVSLFSDALKRAAGYGPVPWGACAFKAQLDFTTSIAILSVPAFIAGGISCLARFAGLTEKENWIYQTGRLKTYLYMSTGLLVLGVLYVKAWIGYPSFLFTGNELIGYPQSKEMEAAFTELANTLTIYIGIEFTIILAAYALPVAWLLSRQADKIAVRIVRNEKTSRREAISASKVHQMRERENLVFSPGDSMRVIVAVLAPFITGALPSLTSAIG